VFLDVKVEGEKLGRIVIELVDDAAVGGQRFADLALGKEGVGYRLSKFDGIFSVSLQCRCNVIAVSGVVLQCYKT
jgi:peptidyl-prolyl cis-trans isomerase B (cyclophilin B)